MAKDCDTPILRSATQKLAEYVFLCQFKGLQLFEAAVKLAKLNPPPQPVNVKDFAVPMMAALSKMYRLGDKQRVRTWNWRCTAPSLQARKGRNDYVCPTGALQVLLS